LAPGKPEGTSLQRFERGFDSDAAEAVSGGSHRVGLIFRAD
jgi:hypothetical protein